MVVVQRAEAAAAGQLVARQPASAEVSEVSTLARHEVHPHHYSEVHLPRHCYQLEAVGASLVEVRLLE